MFWQGIATPTATAAVGPWNMIAQQVAVAQGRTLVENARMFALLDLTLADTAIACWDAKYTYNFWRPVTAIRAADTDGNPDTDPDPNWTPLLSTPSHPSYPSAHATEAGGAAATLAAFFATDTIPFRLSWEGMPGVTRTFAGFTAAADEATMSRIWAGFHWSFDLTAGHMLGVSVSEYIFQNFLLPRTSPPPRTGPASTQLGVNGFTAAAAFSALPGGSLVEAPLGSGTPSGAVLMPGGFSSGTDATGADPSLRQLAGYTVAENTARTSMVPDRCASEPSGARLEKALAPTRGSDVEDIFRSAEAWGDRWNWTR